MKLRQAKPSFLSEMPLDILHLVSHQMLALGPFSNTILLQILGLLSPRELLSLARTNRGFRQTLLADNARPIWKSARMRWPGGSPDCPPDVSEARWADLLFGDAKCDMQGCKFEDVPVNFTLRRRVCEACMAKHLVSDRVSKRNFPYYDKSILALIPSGNAGCRSQFWGRKKSKYYWDADIHNMSKQVTVYREDIRLGKVGAEDAFLSFKSARTAYVKYAIEHAQVCLKWWEEQERLRREQVRLRIEARENGIFERFEELGYERQDFKYLDSDVLTVDAELTENDWHEVRATLEPFIMTNRTKRLERDRRALLMRRRRVVNQVCTAFKITLPPLQWPTFPPLHELYQMEGFLVLINDPSSDELEPHRCAHVLEALPSFIAARRDNIRSILLEKLPPNLVAQTASASTDTISDPLSLATATFQCSGPSWSHYRHWILPTLSDVLAFLSNPPHWHLPGHAHVARDMFEFSEAGHDAVVSLLTLLGLDVRTTTPGELDKLDARFICMRCPANINEVGSKFHDVFDWRQCIQHYIVSKGIDDHATPEWMLLDANSTRLVKMQSDLGWDWSCAHCFIHSEKTVHLYRVFTHVQRTHNVPEPAEGVDFFNAKPHKHQFRSPVAFEMNLQGGSS
ncbi:hypothetical protein WOLCODRAFT_150532 [Wolfiporia cocos MD-104 SS10]|uniref:F-box domain-containing protein n=1 Tax=Wolfiporia cocos (strain MD-104) TaxID=742152 RepID=A0A2H3JF27_WOLCO|nr:hypothetical protein WOLCODRAFT_150532 [Wolfiporia cocos MD-104 SS10]